METTIEKLFDKTIGEILNLVLENEARSMVFDISISDNMKAEIKVLIKPISID